MSKYQIAMPGAAPSAPQRDPGRDAYLAWCADCEPILRLILLGSDAEIDDWTLRKAQARRVAAECGQDLGAIQAAMRGDPTQEDRRRADGMRERIRKTRAWALAELGGELRQILRRLVAGADPEALLALLDVRTLPPPSQAAESYARAQVGVRRPRSEDERMRDAEADAELWVGRT